MSDLVEFLRARLDEDEQVAKAASEYHDAAWRVDPEDAGTLLLWDPMPDSPGFGHTMNERVTAHIALHDPARVLAEVAAKRRQITLAFACESLVDSEWGCVHSAGQIEAGECPEINPDEIEELRALAQVYAGHSDYRQEWAPDLA